MDSEIWLWLSVVLGVVAIALILLLMMERERKKPLSEAKVKPSRIESPTVPLSVRKTVTTNMYKEARDRLRVLDLEREILSYAIRRLYEASAEKKITEEERDRLAFKYKEDLGRIKDEIARGESIVALNDLEKMQEEFVKLFSERFEELNKRIGELRTLSGFVPPKLEKPEESEEPTEPTELEEPSEEEEKYETPEAPEQLAEKETSLKTKRKVSKPKITSEDEKTEAEKKVEQIVAEVEKVLKKLGQMEVEE